MPTTLYEWLLFIVWAVSVPFSINIFESKVKPYTLPELTDATTTRELFTRYVYGELPTSSPPVALTMFYPEGSGHHPTILSFHLYRKAKYEHLPVDRLTARGYAVATMWYEDIARDDPKAAGEAISAWAAGLIRAMDELEKDPNVDASRVALFGFSRLGKASLWAAANDERFAAVISDSAGKGGDTLSHRNFGETIGLMTLRFPHWFTPTYASFVGRENDLPIDQHMLLATIAPRPLLISHARSDWWSDPMGAERAVNLARPAYERLNAGNHLVFDLHNGGHAVTLDEWEIYLDFLDSVLKY